MKNVLKLLAVISLLVLSSCSDEQLNEEFNEELTTSIEAETLESQSAVRATPEVTKVYTIKNKKSGRTLDINGGSNSNGANLQVFGTDENTSLTNRQWEIISVGNGYVRLRGVDSGKSLEVAGGSNSNNANVQQWAYQGTTHQQWEILSVGSGYFRLKNRDSGKSLRASGTSNGSNAHQYNYRGWDSQKWFFTEVGGNNDDGGNDNDNGGGSNGGDAEDIIGGRNNWKLNGFSGSLRVGNNDNGLDYEDDASLNESHFFFENNGYATFRCYPGNPTSGGSSNARSELREVIDGGDGYWDGTTSTERSMKWRVRIEDLPPSGKLAFGQIHERDDDFDDIIRVQVQGNGGQNSGDVDLRILGYVTEELGSGGITVDFDMNMDTEYYFELTMRNSVVRLYELNNSGNRVRTLYTSPNVGDADENYFKAGCYLQSTSSSHDDSNVYGQVAIKDISVSPND